MDFEEWKKESLSKGESKTWVEWFELAFEAGQQSKQAEIDALKEKLKKLEDHIFINYDDERDDDQHSYWSGYNVALGEIAAIIEENNNDA